METRKEMLKYYTMMLRNQQQEYRTSIELHEDGDCEEKYVLIDEEKLSLIEKFFVDLGGKAIANRWEEENEHVRQDYKFYGGIPKFNGMPEAFYNEFIQYIDEHFNEFVEEKILYEE